MTSSEERESEQATLENAHVVLYTLPQQVMHDAVGELAAFVLAHVGKSIILDGSHVRQIGAQGAQVLAMASQSWSVEGGSLTVRDPNEVLKTCLDHLGLCSLIPFEQQKGEAP